MLIIHVTGTLGGGVGQVIYDLCVQQIDNGHTVAVIYRPIIIDNEVTSILALRKLGIILMEAGRINRPLVIRGLSVQVDIERIRQNIYGVDSIIHYHTLAAIGLFGGISVPAICTIHGISHNLQHTWYGKIIESVTIRRILKHNVKLVCVSRDTQSFYRQVVPGMRSEVIPNGISMTPSANGKPSVSEEFVVGFIGQLNSLKGYRLILEAIDLIPKSIVSKMVFRFVGGADVDEKTHISNCIKKMRDSCTIEYLGPIADAKTRVLPTFSVIVLPSQSEGMPLVLLEAMSIGIPALATAVGGIPEILHEGRTGFFINRDAQDIAAKITYLYSNAGIIAKMRAYSISEFRSKYTSSIMANSYEKLYKCTLGAARE